MKINKAVLCLGLLSSSLTLDAKMVINFEEPKSYSSLFTQASGGEVEKLDSYEIKGTICYQNEQLPIDVHAYIGGKYSDYSLGSVEKVVVPTFEKLNDTICESTDNARTFTVEISHDQLSTLRNEVQLWSVSSGSPSVSKLISLPIKVQKGTFQHTFDPLTNESVLWGWACNVDIGTPPELEVFMKNAHHEEQISSVQFDFIDDVNVTKHCISNLDVEQAGLANFRFKAFLPSNSALVYEGKQPVVRFKHGDKSQLNSNSEIIAPVQKNLSELSNVNNPEGVVTIEKNTRVIIDKNIDTREIIVKGELLCNEDNRDFSVSTRKILIDGQNAKLSCGSETQSYLGLAQFLFKGGAVESNNGQAVGVDKGIMIANGGELSLFGKGGKEGVYNLVQDALVGETAIELDREAFKWEVGDEIVITSSGFDFNEAEKRTIVSINNNIIEFHEPLNNSHIGRVDFLLPNTQGLIINESSEVVNLTRNIKIRALSPIDSNKMHGGHVMVMGGAMPGSAFIDGVEFSEVGQMGVTGRYPFHWHKVGDATGQFIRNSSIHNSYNRCVVVHDTNNALVENNSCYDHFGHGFFLESGKEIDNHLLNNIGIGSKLVPNEQFSQLISEKASSFEQPTRFAAPATFWISNPDNTVEGNIAAGSEGTGFWMSFDQQSKKEQDCIDDNKNCPAMYRNTKAFNNNIAHSSIVGFTHDGGRPLLNNQGVSNEHNNQELVNIHYTPEIVPVFGELKAYKNALTGIYYRGTNAIFDRAVLANNGVSIFFAYEQELRNSAIIGQTDTLKDEDFTFQLYDCSECNDADIRRKRWQNHLTGVLVYDGPFLLDNVTFFNFQNNDTILNNSSLIDFTPKAFMLNGGAARYINKVRNLSFEWSESKSAVNFSLKPLTAGSEFNTTPTNSSWIDSFSAAILDLDGSLLAFISQNYDKDYTNSMVRPIDSFNDDNCEKLAESSILACDYNLNHLLIEKEGSAKGNFTVYRNDGCYDNDLKCPSVKGNGTHFFNKFSMITSKNVEQETGVITDKYSYVVEGLGYEPFTAKIAFSSAHQMDESSLIRIKVNQSFQTCDLVVMPSGQVILPEENFVHDKINGELRIRFIAYNALKSTENDGTVNDILARTAYKLTCS
ncbi:G8 domain-containing protein [Pseudoalteromonas spongiae]|uniref:G8 domain-containing protein n=1 Tax=Pseudoalteromonas spongiae TaxID=298657 RepID=UPI00373686F7